MKMARYHLGGIFADEEKSMSTFSCFQEIQEKWMSEFDTNPGAAVTTLCQFVFHATGCKANLPTRIHGNTDFGHELVLKITKKI